LILGYIAAVVSAIFLSRKYLGHSGITDHATIGLVVFAMVIAHLVQRRHTVRRLTSRLFGRPAGRQSRQAVSDAILWILTLNTMISGAADFIVGHTILLSIPGPYVFQKWHAMSAVVLVIYVIVHVIRRRKRLLTSRVT
jgi:heme exporter protein D